MIAVAGIIVFYYTTKNDRLKDSEVFLYTTATNADLLSWGNTRYKPILSGGPISEGDRIKTLQDSKSMVLFYGDYFARIDQSSQILFARDEIIDKKRIVSLSLEDGRYWFDWISRDKDNLLIAGQYFSLSVQNARFDIFIRGNLTSIKVVEGSAQIKVLDNADNRIRLLDQEEIFAGWQAYLSKQIIEQMKSSLAVEYLLPITKKDLEDDWYKWNIAQSADPNEFIKQNSYISSMKITESDPMLSNFLKISIISPDDRAKVTDGRLVIQGKVSSHAEQIEVFAVNKANRDYFKLEQFKPGDEEFIYRASNQFGNLWKGENIYQIMASSLSERQSTVTEVRVEG